MAYVEGSCLCGAVRFRVALPVKWVANCHCSLCRRAHGAPFVTWVSTERAGLEITASDTLAEFVSSDHGKRRFCARCGSPVFFEGTGWPGEVHVSRALLPDDAPLPAAMGDGFWDSRAPWLPPHDLKKFPDPKPRK